VEVVIDAAAETAVRCLPRALGRVEALDEGTCRLVGSTSNPAWYAQQLAAVPAAYRVVRCPEVQEAARVLGQRLLAAATGEATLP
ncbi:MAG: WCX domain-containing protein, partial [Oryzihumus sp.]